MKDQGWIKLHRKLLNNAMATKPSYMWLWINLLLMANHKEKQFIWNNRKQTVKKGQILTGLKQLSKKTGIAQGTVYRILKYLENEKQIEQQKTTKFTLITVLNWDVYQQNEKQNEKQIENRLKTNEKQIETNKNEKNVKNEKNEKELIHEQKFERFWKMYPRKKAKKLCKLKYQKIEKEHNKIMVGLEKVVEYWTRNKTAMQHIPYPATWLNQERWNDEIEEIRNFERESSEDYY